GGGAQAAVNAANLDVAGAGFNVHVALAVLFNVDVATAGVGLNGSRGAARFHIARAGMNPQVAGEVAQPHVARSGLDFDPGLHAFDGLIARSRLCAEARVGGRGNLVVDRNVVDVHVIDAHAAATLAAGGILLYCLGVGLAVPAKPAVANMDLANDRNGPGGAGVNRHVAGTSHNFKVASAADLQGFLESPLLGCDRKRGCQQETESDCQRLR